MTLSYILIMPSFNLLSEPWINCTTHDGAIVADSILGVLRNAPHLRGVMDPSPLVEFGVYRVLAVFVTDALGITCPNIADEIFSAGHFPMIGIEQYASAWHDRFDLFDATHPFFQVPASAARAGKKQSLDPVSVLFQDLPHGTNRMFFAHDIPRAICAAACARALCAMPPFMTVGGVGKRASINGTPPWYFWAVGRTLFETLLLNALGFTYASINIGADPPAWRAEYPETKNIVLASTFQGLTWQPRAVRLMPADAGEGTCEYTGDTCGPLVRDVVFDQGVIWAGGVWQDPNVMYRTRGKKPPFADRKATRAVIPSPDALSRAYPGMSAWMDAGRLLLLRDPKAYTLAQEETTYSVPAVITALDANPDLPCSRVDAYGLRTDHKMKLCDWKKEPLSIAVPERARQETLAQAAQVESALYQALHARVPAIGTAIHRKAYGDALFRRARHLFWEEARECLLVPSLLWVLGKRILATVTKNNPALALRFDQAQDRHTIPPQTTALAGEIRER